MDHAVSMNVQTASGRVVMILVFASSLVVRQAGQGTNVTVSHPHECVWDEFFSCLCRITKR